MNIIVFVSVGMIGVFFAVLMRKLGEEYRICVSVFCVSSLVIAIMPYLSELISEMLSFVDISGANSENFMFLLKAVGIAYVCQFSSDICSDAGETAIASKIEFAGRVCILAMTIPVMWSLIDLIEKML